MISDRDNVATALEALEPGRRLEIRDTTVTVRDAIPRGHKVALTAIAAGDPVIKYGSPIGLASAAIEAGGHVHTHNLASSRGRGDLEAGSSGAREFGSSGDRELRSAEEPEPRLAEPADDRGPEQKQAAR